MAGLNDPNFDFGSGITNPLFSGLINNYSMSPHWIRGGK